MSMEEKKETCSLKVAKTQDLPTMFSHPFISDLSFVIINLFTNIFTIFGQVINGCLKLKI